MGPGERAFLGGKVCLYIYLLDARKVLRPIPGPNANGRFPPTPMAIVGGRRLVPYQNTGKVCVPYVSTGLMIDRGEKVQVLCFFPRQITF